MREVTVSRSSRAPRDVLLDQLSPTTIIDHLGIYEIEAVEERDDDVVMQVVLDDIESTFIFRELEDGLYYEQRDDDGVFEEMYTRITVEEGDQMRVVARSEFTFGSIWAFVIDRLAERHRRRDLELIIQRVIEGAE